MFYTQKNHQQIFLDVGANILNEVGRNSIKPWLQSISYASLQVISLEFWHEINILLSLNVSNGNSGTALTEGHQSICPFWTSLFVFHCFQISGLLHNL